MSGERPGDIIRSWFSKVYELVNDHKLSSDLGKCYAPCRDYPSPGFGSGWTRSLDGHGFSERVAAPTRLSRPGFQSRTEGSS